MLNKGWALLRIGLKFQYRFIGFSEADHQNFINGWVSKSNYDILVALFDLIKHDYNGRKFRQRPMGL